MTSKDERERREAMCQKCPDLLKTPIPFTEKVVERCGVCGCPTISKLFVGCPKSKF